MAISVNKTTRDEIITVLAVSSILMLVIILQIIQHPTAKEMQQSIEQGQHQSEANYYWRGR